MKNRIAKLRDKNDMTQTKLAELLETSVGMVSMLESGERRLNTGWTEKLAIIFGCKQSEIWEDQSDISVQSAIEKLKKTANGFPSALAAIDLVNKMLDDIEEEKR